jgi:hypothetical protein
MVNGRTVLTEVAMNRQILHGALVAVFFTALAGTATAQEVMAAMSAGDTGDMKSSPTRAGGDTTPPPAPADMKSDKSDSSAKATESTSKDAKPAQHAMAKSKSTTEKKSAHHVAKSTGDQAASPDEKAFRQALRGCATEQEQSQRDSCLDEAIEKFQRNT